VCRGSEFNGRASSFTLPGPWEAKVPRQERPTTVTDIAVRNRQPSDPANTPIRFCEVNDIWPQVSAALLPMSSTGGQDLTTLMANQYCGPGVPRTISQPAEARTEGQGRRAEGRGEANRQGELSGDATELAPAVDHCARITNQISESAIRRLSGCFGQMAEQGRRD
jgi:hypothetical protein